jgi:hypothetical protein
MVCKEITRLCSRIFVRGYGFLSDGTRGNAERLCISSGLTI